SVRSQVIGRLKIHRRNLFALHKAYNIDGLSRLDIRAAEIFVGEDDIAFFLILVPLDDLIPGHLFSRLLVVLLEADGLHITAIQHGQVEIVSLFSGVESDRYMDESKT